MNKLIIMYLKLLICLKIITKSMPKLIVEHIINFNNFICGLFDSLILTFLINYYYIFVSTQLVNCFLDH